MNRQNIPPINDLKIKWERLQQKMQENNIDACLIASNANIYYLTGEIFGGYLYITNSGSPICFIKREISVRNDLEFVKIRKPEDIPFLLQEKGFSLPKKIMLEGDQLSYNEVIRLQNLFNVDTTANATSILRHLRMIKTPWEIEQLRYSTKKHAEVYKLIPSCFYPGISDIEFQVNLERIARINGSLGIFRGFGNNMEIHMGSILTGENAETPSPFDFALGGGGIHPSSPVGANGTILKKGTSVMVDIAGNYTAYLSDMTRTFSIGKLPDIAYKAHQISIEIQNKIIENGYPGVACSDLYNLATETVHQAGLSDFFMGTRFQAKFIGHGVGIEINEPPVIMAKSKELLEPNMTFALEPKFVLPTIGAVGIENTFLVTQTGLEKLTIFEENIGVLG